MAHPRRPARPGCRRAARGRQHRRTIDDVVIGTDATILPHSVVLPGSRIGAGEIWGGVPARHLSVDEMARFKAGVRDVAHVSSGAHAGRNAGTHAP